MTSAPFTPHTFSSSISAKLTEDNFLTWLQHAEATIKGFKLKKHISGPKFVPEQFKNKEDEESGNLNPEFENFEQQDNLLKSWLLESMDPQFKIRMVSCEWSHQIWATLKTYFSSQTMARVKQLKTQLRTIKKTGSISELLIQIKHIVETLAAIGSPLSQEEHIDTIFDALPEEYDSHSLTKLLSTPTISSYM